MPGKRLTAEEHVEIERLIGEGYTDRVIAEMIGRHERTVWAYRKDHGIPVTWSKKTAEDHLANAVRDEVTGCLRWQGPHSRGYGVVWVGYSSTGIHRLAYEEWAGPIPEDRDIDHVYARGCRYRDCIEPTHLEAVTREENLRRMRLAVEDRNRKAA